MVSFDDGNNGPFGRSNHHVIRLLVDHLRRNSYRHCIRVFSKSLFDKISNEVKFRSLRAENIRKEAHRLSSFRKYVPKSSMTSWPHRLPSGNQKGTALI